LKRCDCKIGAPSTYIRVPEMHKYCEKKKHDDMDMWDAYRRKHNTKKKPILWKKDSYLP